tara:strand:+ start:7780 stop:10068 length:2289 start_codon:yes stop_codon:yes gene_type:complete
MAFTFQDLQDVVRANNVETAVDIQMMNIFSLVHQQGDSSFLQLACQNQAEQMTEYILDQPGIDIDYQNANGYSALHDAVKQNHLGIINLLIKKGINVNLRTGDLGETALFLFIRHSFQESKPINYEILEILINHPDNDLFATSVTLNGDDSNLLDYCVQYSPKEEYKKMITDPESGNEIDNPDFFKFINIFSKIFQEHKDKFINRIEHIYEKILFETCGCGHLTHGVPDSKIIVNLIWFMKLCKIGLIPDKINETNFYTWITNIAKKQNDDLKNRILKVVNKFVDRLDYFIENTDPKKCSVLETILKNNDFELIDLYNQASSKDPVKYPPFDWNRKCQKNDLTPIEYWFYTISGVISENDMRQMCELATKYEVLDELKKNKSNFTNKIFCSHSFTDLRPSIVIHNIDSFKVLLEYNLICHCTQANLMDMYNNLPSSIALAQPLIKSWLEYSSKINKLSFKNECDIGSMESIWKIPDTDFILLENLVVWDVNSLCDYVVKITKGINEFDKHFIVEELRGKPIWSRKDMEFLKYLSKNYNIESESGIILYEKLTELINYLDYAKYLDAFSDVEKEHFRKFTSIFWARGEYWEYEISKFLTQEELKEWNDAKPNIGRQEMPNKYMSSKLSDKLGNIKAIWLAKFKDFYNSFDQNQKYSLKQLHVRCNEHDIRSYIQGDVCIMCIGDYFNKVLKKMGLDVQKSRPELLLTNNESSKNKTSNPELTIVGAKKTKIIEISELEVNDDQENQVIRDLLDNIPRDKYYYR